MGERTVQECLKWAAVSVQPYLPKDIGLRAVFEGSDEVFFYIRSADLWQFLREFEGYCASARRYFSVDVHTVARATLRELGVEKEQARAADAIHILRVEIRVESVGEAASAAHLTGGSS